MLWKVHGSNADISFNFFLNELQRQVFSKLCLNTENMRLKGCLLFLVWQKITLQIIFFSSSLGVLPQYGILCFGWNSFSFLKKTLKFIVDFFKRWFCDKVTWLLLIWNYSLFSDILINVQKYGIHVKFRFRFSFIMNVIDNTYGWFLNWII